MGNTKGRKGKELPKSQKLYTMEERKAKKMGGLIKRFGKLLKPEYEKAKVLSTAGGFSTVIKALNTGLKREEAIKAIDLDAVEEEGMTMEKVMQEVTMLAKLDHNNIVKVYNKLRKNDDEFDYLFLIMELCTSTLVDTLKSHPNGVPIKEARNILSQIVDGVAYLHSKKIIHRDLKPPNIFIKDDIIKIGDFNISKEIGKGDMTRASQMLVTIHYCPPERAIHQQPGDYRVDLWSIGVIYFQLLHGIRPFNGATVEDLCHNIEFIKYPPITKGDAFDRKVIQMCLVTEKDRCYITDLQNFIKDTPKVPLMEETKAQPVLEIGEVETQLLPKIVGKAGVSLTEETKAQPVLEVGEVETQLLPKIVGEAGPKVMEKSPKSLHFAAKLEQGKIIIFDQDLKIINTIQSSLSITKEFFNMKSAVTSSGSRLITCGEKGIEHWETSSSPCKLTHTNSKITKIKSVEFLPNNLLAAAGATKGIIYIMKENGDISHELRIPIIPEKRIPESIYSLLYVEGSQELWAGDGDGYIHIAENSLISVVEGEHEDKGVGVYTLRTLPQRVHKLIPGAFNLRERNIYKDIVSGGPSGVGVWGYDGSLLYLIELGGLGYITSFSILSGENIIRGGSGGTMDIWEATGDGQSRITSFKPHQGYIHGIQTVIDSQDSNDSQDSQLCVSGSTDGTIKLLNPHKGEVLRELNVGDKVAGMTKIYIN